MAASGGKNYSEHTYKLDKFNDKFYITKATVTICTLINALASGHSKIL